MPELGPVLVELRGTAGAPAAPLPPVTTVRVSLTGPAAGETDAGPLLVLVTHPVALEVLAGAGRGEAAGRLLHPVDAGVQITNILVAQLGTVGVVYTGNLLQIPNISN